MHLAVISYLCRKNKNDGIKKKIPFVKKIWWKHERDFQITGAGS